MIVRELVAGVFSPGDRSGVKRTERDDQKGDDDEDGHGGAPFDVLTRFNGLIGYFLNSTLLRVTCQ
jgi:hypothetical protein